MGKLGKMRMELKNKTNRKGGQMLRGEKGNSETGMVLNSLTAKDR